MDLVNVTRMDTTDTSWRFVVAVTQAGDEYGYSVTLNRGYLDKLFLGAEPDELIRKTFAFLLAREGASAILKEFNVEEVKNFYPDFEEVVVGVR